MNITCILVKVFIAEKRHHGQGNSFTGQHLKLGLAYGFRGSDPYHHGKKHGSVVGRHSAGEEDRVLHLDPKALRRRLASRQLGGGSQSPSQSDSLLPTKPHLLIVPLPGPSIFKPPYHLSTGNYDWEPQSSTRIVSNALNH